MMVIERTKQRFQNLHIKTLAQVKLRNQRDKPIGRNDGITAAHTTQYLIIPLSGGVPDRLGVQHQSTFVKRLLNLRQQPYLFARLIGNLLLRRVQR